MRPVILVDFRDGSRELLDLIDPSRCDKADLSFDVDGSGRLVPCGDAMVIGNGPANSTISVGVELKSIHDALSSISTGRLGGTQIPRMLKVYDVIFLLIFGICRPGPDNFLQVRKGKEWKKFRLGRRPVPWSYFEGFLLTAQIQATMCSKPVFVKQVYNLYEASVWLTILDHWLEKPWDKHRGLAVFDKSREMAAVPDADPVEVQMARTAASFPAIDFVKGWAAAKHFESVEQMVQSTMKGWTGVRGIGPTIAKSTYEAIHRKRGQ